MIFIFTDPGVHGAISAIDENEQILFSVGLVDGLPPKNFTLDLVNSPLKEKREIITIRSTRTLSGFIEDWHFGIEIADYKNVEVGKWKPRIKADGTAGKPTIITADKIYHSGIITGKIIHWFTERGVHDMLQIKPREWQTIYKGFAGKDSKERAFNCLKEKYCEFVLRKHAKCKNCYTPCPLKKHGIIGPRGGYVDGKGDSVCGALHLKNMVRQRKVR
ncbi:hypothetical protein LCGC14_2939320 [marine sediment metagenome]|uniref:Uncharacterized protein n=1 Tax=marine sediment metagenome TaxID=412755 RepID=A0A0F9A9L6_9ZZZZ